MTFLHHLFEYLLAGETKRGKNQVPDPKEFMPYKEEQHNFQWWYMTAIPALWEAKAGGL